MENYTIGSGTQEIHLAVDLSTFGLAATRALVFDSSNNRWSSAHSVNATGDIAGQTIGTADKLKDKSIRIVSKVDILGDDQEDRERQCKDIKQVYSLAGGIDGVKKYGQPDIKQNSDDFTVVYLLKTIHFI